MLDDDRGRGVEDRAGLEVNTGVEGGQHVWNSQKRQSHTISVANSDQTVTLEKGPALLFLSLLSSKVFLKTTNYLITYLNNVGV